MNTFSILKLEPPTKPRRVKTNRTENFTSKLQQTSVYGTLDYHTKIKLSYSQPASDKLFLCFEVTIRVCYCTTNILKLRGYYTLQVDNSLKSVERFGHMMFVCIFQASRLSKPQREKLLCAASEFIALSLLVGIC